MAATESRTVPRISYRDEFLPEFVERWDQGQHVVIVGPTQTGKSTVALSILAERARRRDASVVVFGTKPRDPVLAATGWPRVKSGWPLGYGVERAIYWPEYGDPETVAARQRGAFRPVLRAILADGGWVVFFDEVHHFERKLGLRDQVAEYLRVGASNDVTTVVATQRPVGVSREVFSEPSWAIIFRVSDEDELRRVGEIGGDREFIRSQVKTLGPYEFLCVQTRTGAMVRSKVRRRRANG